jgi:hypothetical protein
MNRSTWCPDATATNPDFTGNGSRRSRGGIGTEKW